MCKYWKCYQHAHFTCKEEKTCMNIHTGKECGDCKECMSCVHFDEAYPENDGYCWRYEEKE